MTVEAVFCGTAGHPALKGWRWISDPATRELKLIDTCEREWAVVERGDFGDYAWEAVDCGWPTPCGVSCTLLEAMTAAEAAVVKRWKLDKFKGDAS